MSYSNLRWIARVTYHVNKHIHTFFVINKIWFTWVESNLDPFLITELPQ